jgi:hypothetical protein
MDGFRERGSKRLNDLIGPVTFPECPGSWLTCAASSLHSSCISWPPYRATVAQMAELGVKRNSLGGAFANAAFSAFLRAAQEVAEKGTFTFRSEASGSGQVGKLISGEI